MCDCKSKTYLDWKAQHAQRSAQHGGASQAGGTAGSRRASAASSNVAGGQAQAISTSGATDTVNEGGELTAQENQSQQQTIKSQQHRINLNQVYFLV